MKKKVLVTGASGYIGSHVCMILKEHGHSVHGWDIHHHGEFNDISNVCDEFSNQDITDSISKCNFDAVIHLAGLTVVPESIRIPSKYYQTNLFGTQNILDNVDSDHFIFASTSSAWSMESPYAKSKVAAEDIIKEISKGYTIFRFFNVSGSNGKYRQLGPSTHLIRVAAEVATGKRSHLEIYGTDYPTRDGTCIRDYVHVVDLSKAIVKSVEQGPMNTPYECIGSNTGSSVIEVIKAMEHVTGKKLKTINGPRRPGDSVINSVDKLSTVFKLEKNLHDMCYDQFLLEKGIVINASAC